MSFAPVKSDPWKKRKRRKPRFQLWPNDFWSRLVRKAYEELPAIFITDQQIEMIAEMNMRLYGLETTEAP